MITNTKNLDTYFRRLIDEKIEFEESTDLSKLSNTRTGGCAQGIVFPKNAEQLTVAIQLTEKFHVRMIVLGDMTNVAIASGDLNFVVISMSKFDNTITYDKQKNVITVSAGMRMKKLALWALDNSITGLQWMEGIPGTVGAGAYMNAGFLPGQDFQNVLIDAQVLMPDHTIRCIKNKDFHYGYRHSSIQENGGIVLSVRLLVRKGKHWKIWVRMHQYHTRRAKHQPLDLPSAGTVFVPPTPYHVGGMLPQLGLVGHRVGGAEVSTKSPGFIVGVDKMTGEDYYQLVHLIQSEVSANYGIDLEPEVRLIGFDEGTVNATE